MASGAELLKQLRQRRLPAEQLHTQAYYAASRRAPQVTPAPEDEWSTDDSGRQQRIFRKGTAAFVMPITGDDKAPCRHGIRSSACLACREAPGGLGRAVEAGNSSGAGGSAAGGSSCSLDGDAVMRTAALQGKLVERANAAADDLVAASLEAAVSGPPEADEEAAGWDLVRQHNSEFACWIVIGGRVLDATSYLGHHPGGSMVIQKLAGRDATKAYERAHHSRGADMKLADFSIGALSDLKRLNRAARAAREHRERLERAAAYLS